MGGWVVGTLFLGFLGGISISWRYEKLDLLAFLGGISISRRYGKLFFLHFSEVLAFLGGTGNSIFSILGGMGN